MEFMNEKQKIFLNVRILECPLCKGKFSTHSNLRRHMKLYHSNVEVELEPVCGNENDPKSLARCFEANCTCTFRCRHDLRKHLSDYHHLPQLEILKEFENEQEFLVWKNTIENCTNSNFVCSSGEKKKKSGTCYKYFDCSRSGKAKEKRSEETVPGKKCLFVVCSLLFIVIEI